MKIISIIFILFFSLFIIGCSKEHVMSYDDVVSKCMNYTYAEKCGMENCILSYSTQFTDAIQYGAQKNYLNCRLLECKIG